MTIGPNKSVNVVTGEVTEISMTADEQAAAIASMVTYAGAAPARLIVAITIAVQERLDAFAQTRGYDGILSAATYATSAVPAFAAEGQYCVNARDSAWATCYDIMAQVQAGTHPMPTVESLLAELPVLEWPV